MARLHPVLLFVDPFLSTKRASSNLSILQYSTEVIGGDTGVVQGQAEGTLLARHENIRRPYFAFSEHTLELETRRFGATGSLNFSHAIVYVDTYAIE